MKNYFAAALVISTLLAPSAYSTNGTRMMGFTGKTIGRGGASIGFFDSPSLMMSNPGGLSFLTGSSLEGDFSLMIPSVSFQNSLNAETKGETNLFPLFSLGYVDRQKQSDWTWGIGAFTQGGMGADFTLNNNLFRDQSGTFIPQRYHSKLGIMEAGPSVSYKLTPAFSIGVTAHVVYSMLEFQMPYSLAPSIMNGVANPLTGMTFGQMFAAPPASGGFGYTEVTAAANMNNLAGFGFNGKIGLAYVANENLSLGMSYSSPTTITHTGGKATMDMTAQLNDAFGKAVQGYMMQNPSATAQQAQTAIMTQFGQMGIDMSKGVIAHYNLEAELTFPQTLGVGAMITISDPLKVAVDVEWTSWSNAFYDMKLKLTDGDNSNINTMLGTPGTLSVNFPMKWSDSYTIRVGGEYTVNPDLTVRAGFAHGTNPVPGQTLFPVFPAIVENHVMVGASYRVARAITLHAAYELALNNEQTAAGQSAVAREYDNSVSQLQESIVHLSATWELD